MLLSSSKRLSKKTVWGVNHVRCKATPAYVLFKFTAIRDEYQLALDVVIQKHHFV